MSLLLDAGALVAVERAHRFTIALIKQELLEGRAPLTHGGVLGQVWRGGAGRQANLARLLPGLDIAAVDETLGRRAGILLERARMDDVIDAALLASDGDSLLTSGPSDLVWCLLITWAVPPQPEGPMGVAGDLLVAIRRR